VIIRLGLEDDIKSFFWLTTQQQEIDYIEEQSEKLSAYELKWNPITRINFPELLLKPIRILKPLQLPRILSIIF
jgi:hypothetical protein